MVNGGGWGCIVRDLETIVITWRLLSLPGDHYQRRANDVYAQAVSKFCVRNKDVLINATHKSAVFLLLLSLFNLGRVAQQARSPFRVINCFVPGGA